MTNKDRPLFVQEPQMTDASESEGQQTREERKRSALVELRRIFDRYGKKGELEQPRDILKNVPNAAILFLDLYYAGTLDVLTRARSNADIAVNCLVKHAMNSLELAELIRDRQNTWKRGKLREEGFTSKFGGVMEKWFSRDK